MIYVRDDDVLLPSSSWSSPLGRLQQIHNWINEVPDHMVHIPTILCTEIQEFPEAIDYVRSEMQTGRMLPQLHGWEHIDYGKLPYDEVIDNLTRCQDWMNDNLAVVPTSWYTPWGASQPHLHQAAAEKGMELIDCSKITKLNGRYGAIQRLKDGADPIKEYDGRELFMHWWEGGSRLKRIVEVVKYKSWVKAEEVNDGGIFH